MTPSEKTLAQKLQLLKDEKIECKVALTINLARRSIEEIDLIEIIQSLVGLLETATQTLRTVGKDLILHDANKAQLIDQALAQIDCAKGEG